MCRAVQSFKLSGACIHFPSFRTAHTSRELPFADISELKAALDHLKDGCAFLFFPLNDSAVNSVPGSGAHWSLLVADLANRQTWHVDSAAAEGNETPAANLAGQIAQAAGGVWSHSDVECAKQGNSFDCGVFCALFLCCVLKALSQSKTSTLTSHNISQACLDLDAEAGTAARCSWLESAYSALQDSQSVEAC